MMETFLEDAEYSLHHRNTTSNPGDGDEGSQSSGSRSGSSSESDDPFLYDKFLPDPDWSLKNRLAEEEEKKSKNLVDPGVFRYNKRVFLSCLPGVMVILALGGESLVFLVAVATAVIATMTQLGDSRRCVVIFIMFFIPTHVYVLSSVIPLLWLSGWHLLSVVAVNMFVILTGGWVIVQFKAFRMEETQLAALIELILFTLYPLLSCGLLCWSLTAVIKPLLIPILFSLMWFIELQIYLIPTVSSFRSHKSDSGSGSAGGGGGSGGDVLTVTGIAEENLDVLQVPMVILTVTAFVLAGPSLCVAITLLSSTATFFTWMTLVHLIFMLSLTLFLISLLSIRQIFEYMAVPYTVLITIRWVAGIACTVLCYPVLHDYGLDSHFLPWLPVAIAMFASLGVVLGMRRRKVIMAVLTSVLVSSLLALFLVWIHSLPHNLPHYFLGYLPLNGLYLVIVANCLLCLASLVLVWMDALAPFGAMLCVQAAVLTVCEVSLHNTGLYSSSLIQLSSLTALYAIYRLQVAEKLARTAAILSWAIHMAKSVAAASSLVLDTARGEITVIEMASLSLMMYAFVTVFVYGTHTEKTPNEVLQQLCLLLGGLAASAHHLLLPVSMVLFQGSHSYSYVLGLWCVVGASLTLLYSQTVATGVKVNVLKLALALGVLGSAIIILHPRLALSFYSLFQWVEMINYVVLVGVLSSQLSLSPQHSVLVSVPLSVCPAIRMGLVLWSHVSLPQVMLSSLAMSVVFILVFICLVVPEITEEAEKVIKYSILVACLSCVGLVGLDWLSWQPPAGSDVSMNPMLSVWAWPAWRAMLVFGLAIAITLKVIHSIQGPHKLPMTLTSEDKGHGLTLTLPVLGNALAVITFLLSCTQGPHDPFQHDLWCCASSIVLGCLHGDERFLPKLSGDKQAAPIVTSSVVYLVVASLARCRVWTFPPFLTMIGGVTEIGLLLITAPIFYSMWTVLWQGEAWSEPAVVFLLPLNTLLFFVGSSYTCWLVGVCGLVGGAWMMMARLPMVPYSSYQPSQSHTS